MRDDEYEALVTKIENAIADWESEGREGYRELAARLLALLSIELGIKIVGEGDNPASKM